MYLYDRRALKEAAKRDLKPCYWMAVLACLIYSAILGGITLTTSSTGLSIIVTLLSGPMTYGLYALFTDVVRGKEFKLETLFEGFKRFGSTFILGLLTQIFTFLWMLLLIVPGYIKSIAYSMAPFIQRDNPDMTANECLQASMKLTNGHKADIFFLHLSFIGWYLLCLLTVGIGLIFLLPYVNMSMARMYDFLILNYNEAHGGKTEELPEADIEAKAEEENPFEN